MTAQLEAAIAAIQALSPTERQQLLQLLQKNSEIDSQPNLKALSTQFWQGVSLQTLRTAHPPATVHDLTDLAADFWPEEDSIEDFLSFLQKQRQELS